MRILLYPITTEKAVRLIEIENKITYAVERKAKINEIKKEIDSLQKEISNLNHKTTNASERIVYLTGKLTEWLKD